MGTPRHRLTFDDLPPAVRRGLEEQLGTTVAEATNRQGGYSPSLAARCRLADGRVVFVKAVSPDQNAESPGILRQEATVSALLTTAAPAPLLLHVIDDGHWIVTVFEYIEGSLPTIPWSQPQLVRVLEATWALAGVEVPLGLPTVAERYGPILTGWRNLAAGSGLDGVLDSWALRHVDR
ncbi:MAG TPA: hypothetical protein VMS00_04445, partial [Acidimicrobiales bacterium]|nr:hypothetical protein [Acidimicrobiales bacterium]